MGSEEFTLENEEGQFWDDATKYTTSGTEDESFVNEMAYLMVTLHQTGG